MAIRNILDSLGNVVGSLTLPDETTEAQWEAALGPYAIAIPEAPNTSVNILTYKVQSTANVTTSSGTAATVGGMTIVPQAGVYQARFNGGIYTDGASAKGEFGIYINGVLLSETRRDISCNLSLIGGLITISLNAIGVGTVTETEIYLDGTQTIDVRFRSLNGGTIGFSERVFTLMRVR